MGTHIDPNRDIQLLFKNLLKGAGLAYYSFSRLAEQRCGVPVEYGASEDHPGDSRTQSDQYDTECVLSRAADDAWGVRRWFAVNFAVNDVFLPRRECSHNALERV